MPFNIEVKKKPLEIKFNYGLMFEVNKKMGSKTKEGEPINDGVGTLFAHLLEQEDEAVFQLIRLAYKTKGQEKLGDADIQEAIEKYVETHEDVEKGYECLFNEIKEEMLNSGFFRKKIQKYIENIERAQKNLEKKTDEKSQEQLEAIRELLQKMKKDI